LSSFSIVGEQTEKVNNKFDKECSSIPIYGKNCSFGAGGGLNNIGMLEAG
jgi:hypothetical protein